MLVLVWLVAGCASTARDVGAAATPVVVRSGLHEANSPDNRQQLQQLLDSPAIQRTGQSIGQGVAIGLYNQANNIVGDGQDQSGMPATIPSTNPSAATRASTPGGAALLGMTHGGGLNSLVQSSVQEAFLAATNPQFRAGEEAMSEAVGEGFVRGMITVFNKEGPAIGDTVRHQLGPIVQDMIREQIAPAVRDMIQQQLAPAALKVWQEGAAQTLQLSVRPDMQPIVIKNAENASIGASHGTHQAMIDSGILTPSSDLDIRYKVFLLIALATTGLIAIAILSLLVMLNLLVLRQLRAGNAVPPR